MNVWLVIIDSIDSKKEWLSSQRDNYLVLSEYMIYRRVVALNYNNWM